MKFRPCIDIHNGKVKQIVGGSLLDHGNQAKENFVATQDAAFYANLYKEKGLSGGHIILLNKSGTKEYDLDLEQALMALKEYPNHLQIGGGITPENAPFFLEHGASHVIVTSYVFSNGQIHFEKLDKLVSSVTKKHLVLDLSCRKRDGNYYIVTDRWQNFTDVVLSPETIQELSEYCDEFLIHAVDVEGKANGIEQELVSLLGSAANIPVTYAGGVGSFEDLSLLKTLGKNRLDVTIGSALNIFGGNMDFNKVCDFMKQSSKIE
ncbi:MAG: phosphoribosylformimino-5-aminoimidazole carboxamide ribotide isomerase [Lachnospiraceae bacterium]|nr:phosphoribosylformimino-5-aminoimidazole carboxamide ribotide isomerase [Lachnospiraceae bacterium]